MSMNTDELFELLGDLPHAPDRAVAAITESGVVYAISAIEAETHDDADGSTTVWLKLKEF